MSADHPSRARAAEAPGKGRPLLAHASGATAGAVCGRKAGGKRSKSADTEIVHIFFFSALRRRSGAGSLASLRPRLTRRTCADVWSAPRPRLLHRRQVRVPELAWRDHRRKQCRRRRLILTQWYVEPMPDSSSGGLGGQVACRNAPAPSLEWPSVSVPPARARGSCGRAASGGKRAERVGQRGARSLKMGSQKDLAGFGLTGRLRESVQPASTRRSPILSPWADPAPYVRQTPSSMRPNSATDFEASPPFGLRAYFSDDPRRPHEDPLESRPRNREPAAGAIRASAVSRAIPGARSIRCACPAGRLGLGAARSPPTSSASTRPSPCTARSTVRLPPPRRRLPCTSLVSGRGGRGLLCHSEPPLAARPLDRPLHRASEPRPGPGRLGTQNQLLHATRCRLLQNRTHTHALRYGRKRIDMFEVSPMLSTHESRQEFPWGNQSGEKGQSSVFH